MFNKWMSIIRILYVKIRIDRNATEYQGFYRVWEADLLNIWV